MDRVADEAFGKSTLIALAIATTAAVITALVVSWLVARRVVQPIRRLADSSKRIARGAYDERVDASGDDELAELAAAFNAMAGSLERSEQRRRRLLADVAHELRMPLATINAHVEGLGDGVLAPDNATLTTTRGETARLARLVDDLQAVSRAEEQQLQLDVRAVRPAALLDAAACAARPAASAADVELAVEAAPDLPRVAVDEGRVAEVFDNLIGNALRHTAAGGSVTLSASADANTVELCIQDTGSGIAPEHLERVFERFFRADAARSRPQGGTGIALAIARAIVEAHGGRIAAASDGPGTGATFTITLPRAR